MLLMDAGGSIEPESKKHRAEEESSFFCFTWRPEERFLMVEMVFKMGQKNASSCATPFNVKLSLIKSMKSLFGEICNAIRMNVLSIDFPTSSSSSSSPHATCIVSCEARHLRVVWCGLCSISALGDASPVACRVIRVSSTLVGVTSSSLTGFPSPTDLDTKKQRKK